MATELELTGMSNGHVQIWSYWVSSSSSSSSTTSTFLSNTKIAAAKSLSIITAHNHSRTLWMNESERGSNNNNNSRGKITLADGVFVKGVCENEEKDKYFKKSPISNLSCTVSNIKQEPPDNFMKARLRLLNHSFDSEGVGGYFSKCDSSAIGDLVRSSSKLLDLRKGNEQGNEDGALKDGDTISRENESEMYTQTTSTSIGIGTDPVHRDHHHHHHKTTSHSHSSTSSSSNVRQKSTGCQTKEKKSSTPVDRYGGSGGTVYQPAGPLIEPHKTPSTNSMPAGILPESVRLPPDLKVTYQTHPPTSSVLTTTSSASNPKASNSKHHHHHHHSHHHTSSKQNSSTSTSTSSLPNYKSTSTEKASGAILHQPYKSASTGTATTTLPLTTQQPNYGVSYAPSGPSSGTSSNGSNGGHLMAPSSISSSAAAAAAALLSQQHQQSTGLTMTSHHHPLSSTSIAAAAGATPSAGMYYTPGFGPHHSPFTPCKYPIVPPDSYRAHSPYPNSYLYAPTTPQPSQSYFMTPFYTPPMTPTAAPVLGASQPRPLLSTHPHSSSAAAAAAAAAYYQTGPPPSAHHPSNYFVTSPPLQSHHSIQPTPAPGHAGLFRPNQSSQPACPCPMESCPPNSINSTNSNNNKLLLPQSVSSASLPAPEAGAKQPLAYVSTATSASVRKDASHPPICTTPAVAADPPKTIQLGPNSTGIDVAQAKQLESAKTFTEQYSLPDDITITPILVSNSNVSQLLNSPSITLSTAVPKKNSKNDIVNNSSFSVAPKQRDIVHVIDPRSGQTTTIAKHISNNNLVVSNMNSTMPGRTTTVPSHVTSVRPNNALHVGKLNPDLDVIVIGAGRKPENLSPYNMSTSVAPHNNCTNKNRKISNVTNLNSTTNTNTKTNKKSKQAAVVGRRVALADNDNNRPVKLTANAKRNAILPFPPTGSNNLHGTAMNLVQPLPPQITVSSATNNFLASSNTNHTNKIIMNNNYNNQIQNLSLKNNPTVNTIKKSENAMKSNKRISLNECIDGLQRKKMRILESAGKVLNQNGSDFSSFTSSFTTSSTNNKGVVNLNKPKTITSTAARVRDLDLDLNLSSTFIKSSDAVAAASALVLNPYPSRPLVPNFSLSPLKNGLRKGGFGQNVQLKKKSPNKMKRKRISGDEKISTRSSTANAKIRTRLSSKSKVPKELLSSDEQHSRSRSRLLRKRLTLGGSGSGRQSESDSSASRSSSAVRLKISGGTNGKLTKESISGGSNKEKPKNFYYYEHANTPTSANGSGGSSGNRSRNVILKVPRITGGRTASPIPSGSAQANYQYNLMNMERSGESPHQNSNKPAEKPKIALGWVPDSAYVGYGPFGQGHRIGTGNLMASTSSTSTISPSASVSDGEIAGGSGTIAVGPSQGISRYATQSYGSMAISAMKKRAIVKPLSPTLVNGALQSMLLSRRQLKWSNGWTFEGEPYEAKVYLKNDDQHIVRICYPATRHDGGDVIQARDCVLLKSGPRKTDLPFVAKVAALWENPLDGEMMFSLLWYYRPEHTDMGRTKEDMSNEIFASKHRDCNSVATIEDRCYVLTFNEYCRYKKRLKQLEEGIPNIPVVPLTNSSMVNINSAADIAVAVWNGIATETKKAPAPTPNKVSPEVVFFCRKVYDYRQKRMLKNPS